MAKPVIEIVDYFEKGNRLEYRYNESGYTFCSNRDFRGLSLRESIILIIDDLLRLINDESWNYMQNPKFVKYVAINKFDEFTSRRGSVNPVFRVVYIMSHKPFSYIEYLGSPKFQIPLDATHNEVVKIVSSKIKDDTPIREAARGSEDWKPKSSHPKYGKLKWKGSDWVTYVKDLGDKVPLSNKEKTDWCVLYNSVIEKHFLKFYRDAWCEKLKIKHYWDLPEEYKNPDFELDKDDHIITVWKMGLEKDLFKIIFSGCIQTTIYKDKPNKVTIEPESSVPSKELEDSFKFEWAGSKE